MSKLGFEFLTKELLHREYVIEGKRVSQIAHKYKIKPQTIYGRMRRFGIVGRTSGSYFKKDLTNRRFGRLLVIKEETQQNTTAVVWVCRCECGKTTGVPSGSLLSGRQSSCGCLHDEYHWKGCGELSGLFWGGVIKAARKRKRVLSITKEYAWDLFLKQSGKCAISGVDIVLSRSTVKNYKTYQETTASLDRIDSTLGYIEGNVQWVHKIVNKIKQDFTDSELIEWVKRVHMYALFLPRPYMLIRDFLSVVSKEHFHYIIRSAMDRKLCLSITKTYIEKLFLHQNGLCALTGEPLILCDSESLNKRHKFTRTASLDRIDSSKGYTVDNVQWVHVNINYMKQNFLQPVFINWCHTIADYQAPKNNQAIALAA